ncbi:MAG TPA: tellurite resistance/C4-dicarboxylate transporter family protein [Casimicrobiaceae bacterium]
MPSPPPTAPVASDPLRQSFPGYFALVMATGIVSIAMEGQGFGVTARILFAVNVVAYAVLWVAGFVRMARSSRGIADDLADHARGPAFLTIVAGTCVLGVQCAQLAGWRIAAGALWVLGLVLWAVLIYAFFAAVTIVEPKPSLEHGLDGSWLLATVSTESIAVLGTIVAGQFARPDVVIFACLVLFLVGAMLYILIIGLIFFRWIFRPMGVHTLTPTYWINMGAVAITTLAGARLVETAPDYAFVASIEHFLAGFTLFFWATGSWWIPLLVAVFAWRHLHQRMPIRYDPQYWSLVFPLGMYSVATLAYAQGNRLVFLYPLARVFGYVSLVAWALTAIGLVRRILKKPDATPIAR